MPPERVVIVEHPTLFRRLRVVAQPELGALDARGAPHPGHVAALTRHARMQLGDLPRHGVTFVSRSGHRTTIAGEADLDELFERAGARVVHPERLPLREQLAAYASAETLVFAEGSAVHGTQLLGRNLGHVVVIARRKNFPFGEVLLSPRSERFSSIDVVQGMITGHDRRRGIERTASGLSLLDMDALLTELAKHGIDLRPHVRPGAFVKTGVQDLQAWMQRQGEHDMRIDGLTSRVAIARGLLRFRPNGWSLALARVIARPLPRRIVGPIRRIFRMMIGRGWHSK